MVSMQIAALVVAIAGGGETVLLDFQAPWCAPCKAMQGPIRDLQQAGYPVRPVNVDQEKLLAGKYHVQNIPCFVLLVDGKEAGRLTGAVRRDELEGLFHRAGIGPADRVQARAQSPDPVMPPSRSPGNDSPLSRNRFAGAPSSRQMPSSAQTATFPAQPPLESGPGPRQRLGGMPAVETSAHAPAPTAQDLIQSSVRLTVADATGFSYGTGTIIDARQGEALIVTCGHIFRDSQGKGEISIDLCGPGSPQKVPARLVSYDLKNDVALVSMRPGVPVRVAPLAAKSYVAKQGDRVVTVGCNNGGPATALDSKVTSINKFLGPPNLQVAGLPVQGRSGGGLFSADGQLIGVCNAADPADNEGLYAALAVIHGELDKKGLAVQSQNAPPTALAATGNTRMPGPVADARFASHAAPAQADGNGMSAAEQAVLGQMKNAGDSAEVICIVRSLGNPQARSEVIKLDRASSAFLKQLSVDREAQEARHLTSLQVRSASQPKPATRR